MQKYIVSFIVTLAVILLTACGTDSKENPPAPEGPYKFYNATTPLVITAPIEINGTITGSEYAISVQLLYYDFVKPGETIEMRSFDYKYGFITNTVVDTDENGRAIFIYNAPEDFNALRGQDITIQAVYFDSTSISTTPDILLTQDFVLQFR